MAHVAEKPLTARRAAAIGAIKMSRRAFALVKAGKLPKGDALAVARVAGIMAAKRTPDLLPLCHPISLDRVTVDFELDASLPGVRARCEASITAKTGVEMEALTGVSVALLSVYDLVKPVDPALEILDIRLEFKEGGKKGHWRHPLSRRASAQAKLRPRTGTAAVITVSDRAHKKVYADESGPLLAEGLRRLGFRVTKRVIVPDERDGIAARVRALARANDAVILTGGTGLSERDVTPEAVQAVCDRMIPGVGESLRALGPVTAPLSRSCAGQLGRCVVVALPGSKGGVRDGLQVLADLLPHALHTSRGGGH